MPARLALARSLNVPAVRMLKDHGIDRFLHTLRALGLAARDMKDATYSIRELAIALTERPAFSHLPHLSE